MEQMRTEEIARGIYKLVLGEPEHFTPLTLADSKMQKEAIEKIPITQKRELQTENIQWKRTSRGITVTLPMNMEEDFYGFGLQLRSINHAGRRRFLKVNSDPVADTGESHAPVPFYISSSGYGLFADTFRYTTFLMGTHSEKGRSAHLTEENKIHKEFSENALYALKRAKEERRIIIDIPAAEGITLYLFQGNVCEVAQRYHMFCGGGCVPPMWGLGVWYRSYGGSSQEDVSALGGLFRKEEMPVDVLGLEPGWHSHSYSCTYKWSYLFPDPDKLIRKCKEMGFHLNLWEHLYVYPRADFYKELAPYAGDYEVWNGLVPDLAVKEACDIFEKYHKEHFVQKGISGFKLDECDNSDYNASNWGFPDSTEFPSGMDGEQMHSAIGILYQRLIKRIYEEEGLRTYSQVRSSGALASSLPFVLYSDLYNHKQFIKGMVNSGFSGLLWCPEVRSCENGDDLLRRIQTVVFSAHAMINSWRIPSPPWKQTDIDKNLAGEEMDRAEYYTDKCRELFRLRKSLLPYLYSAFMEYHKTGKPPVRALVMDYPEDGKACEIEDEYLFGKSMLVCPLTYEDGMEREIYLPKGEWYHFFTGEKVGQSGTFRIHAEYDQIPVFVRAGSVIPWAEPVECVRDDTVFDISFKIFGEGNDEFVLYEDDFTSTAYTKCQNEIVIRVKPDTGLQLKKHGNYEGERYRFTKNL